MSYRVKVIEPFKKDIKKLSKKYISISKDVLELVDSLELQPTQGISLGNDCYKIRLQIKSKNKGKSGGARVITLVKIINETVFLLSIYDKSEKENISDKELLELINKAQEEN